MRAWFLWAPVLCIVLCASTTRAEWPLASPESIGLQSTRLREMESKVRAGEFKKITSVLVARHAKLAYDGVAAWLDQTHVGIVPVSFTDPHSVRWFLLGLAVLGVVWAAGRLMLCGRW